MFLIVLQLRVGNVLLVYSTHYLDWDFFASDFQLLLMGMQSFVTYGKPQKLDTYLKIECIRVCPIVTEIYAPFYPTCLFWLLS